MSRIELNDPSRQFFPIPSEGKKEGWDQFLAIMPDLLSQRLTTREVMPILHAATTSAVNLPEIPKGLQDIAALTLLIQGRDQQSINRVLEFVRDGIFSSEAAQAGHILPDTKAKVNIPRIGQLRQFGERSINNGPNKTIYAAHLKPFDVGEPEPMIYSGLTEGLDEVFDELCAKFDELQEQYKDAPLHERLRVINYFQMWGASVIHPFCDANGRAFGAKLVFDLNRIGMPVTAIPSLGEINPELAENALALVGERFLMQFLMTNGLPLFTSEQAETIERSSFHWQRYTEHLRACILNGIRQGIYPQEEYETFIGGGVFNIVLGLSKDGHMPRRIYEENAPALIEQQRALK